MKFGRKDLCVLAVIFGLALLGGAALAVEYNPGVAVGQYAKYGYSGTGFWFKLEVVAVSGKEVTLRMTGQTPEGAMPPSDSIWNVETGMMNGDPMCIQMVVAANLNQGDAVPPEECGLAITKTETRTYLGASRTVNIVISEYSDDEYYDKRTFVYDKASGMLLEMEMESTDKTTTPPETSKALASVVDTNIFPSTPIPEPGVAALAAMTLMAIVASTRRRN